MNVRFGASFAMEVPWRWRRASAGAQSLNRASAACIAILAMLAVDDAWSAASATQRTPNSHTTLTCQRSCHSLQVAAPS